MLISLTWLRDFVNIPRDVDPRELAERIMVTTAEVEEVSEIKVDARGLIAARVVAVEELPGTSNLRRVELDAGKKIETITAAPVIHVGDNVVYAPPGAYVALLGEIGSAEVSGHSSTGMILPGEAIGIAVAIQEPVFLDDALAPGTPLPPEPFNDWLIEIDNKSITHRPDLWGHYGMAREVAAILDLPLTPYPVASLEELSDASKPEVVISIADADACRRYSGLMLEGVPTKSAPLWMQLRLGHVGMRPISALVDLTNYIMADLGQPMHAFDADKVPQIEVGWGEEGASFRTLDGVDRRLMSDTLMIQCRGRSIALAGVMGGLETEVSDTTGSLLLESANFDPATIRRTAGRLGLRTDASTRFEKSLDPTHTVLAIQRFVELARPIYPDMVLTSRLSDCYPKRNATITVDVDPAHVSRAIGRTVDSHEARAKLAPLGFELKEDDGNWRVVVPSYRATNDVSIEADIIEELARTIGYATIEPTMPRVSIRRFEPNAIHELERYTLEYYTTAQRYNEIHGYLWYDAGWLARLDASPPPSIELRNPAAEGLHELRGTLMPGMLAAVVKNRFHFPSLSLIEIGSVFEHGSNGDTEFRHLGLISAQRGKKAETNLYERLKGALEEWAWRRFSRSVTFKPRVADADFPWEHEHRTADIIIDSNEIGQVSVVNTALRRTMDEHLASWSIVWAEVRLTGLDVLPPRVESQGEIPPYPRVEMDFSVLVPAVDRYAEIVCRTAAFDHPLLKELRYVGSYQGGSIPSDRRSLTFRTVLGHDQHTLVDDEAESFRRAFVDHLTALGYEIRS